MPTVRIVDVVDESTFALVPPCADPSFDHRTCDYWEDADRGSKRARTVTAGVVPTRAARPRNLFGDEDVDGDGPAFNPFAPAGPVKVVNPFLLATDPLADNPFVPKREAPRVAADAPRKLALLARGAAIFGSYAKVLLIDGEPAGYAQFGPLSAYPRAVRVRQLYRQLPDAPLPAVISCIATTAAARGGGHAHALVAAVCEDLAGRGFAAVEVYPEAGASPEATSAPAPAFWLGAGFALAVDDPRFPVLRREL